MRAWAVFQRVFALAMLLLCLPGLAVLALVIKLDSPGPILYQATRVGRGGALIQVHKLRTMRVAADGPRRRITAPVDPRVTRAGGWLRRRRLDELPQLWDVVAGRMALVGPRPEDPAYVDRDDPVWREVLAVRPGITGAAQLCFHDEARYLAGDADAQYRLRVLPAKLRIDRDYVRRQSIARDLRLLAETVAFALGVGHRR